MCSHIYIKYQNDKLPDIFNKSYFKSYSTVHNYILYYADMWYWLVSTMKDGQTGLQTIHGIGMLKIMDLTET